MRDLDTSRSSLGFSGHHDGGLSACSVGKLIVGVLLVLEVSRGVADHVGLQSHVDMFDVDGAAGLGDQGGTWHSLLDYRELLRIGHLERARRTRGGATLPGTLADGRGGELVGANGLHIILGVLVVTAMADGAPAGGYCGLLHGRVSVQSDGAYFF